MLSACLQYLHLRGVLAWRSNNVAVYDSKIGRTRRFVGLKGVSDICGVLRGGKALFVECKKPGGRLSQHQRAFLDAATSAGALAIVVHGVGELIDALESGGDVKMTETLFTTDATSIEDVLARLRACDGRSADAAVIVWEHCQMVCDHILSLDQALNLACGRIATLEGEAVTLDKECLIVRREIKPPASHHQRSGRAGRRPGGLARAEGGEMIRRQRKRRHCRAKPPPLPIEAANQRDSLAWEVRRWSLALADAVELSARYPLLAHLVAGPRGAVAGGAGEVGGSEAGRQGMSEIGRTYFCVGILRSSPHLYVAKLIEKKKEWLGCPGIT